MRIESEFYLGEVEPKHGSLVRLRDKVGKLELINEPRLAESFRLLLPVPGVHANYVLGIQQQLTAFEATREGIKLVWAGPLVNDRGSYDLAVTIWIELIDQDVRFRCQVRNGTEHALAEVWYGLVGGMTGLSREGSGEQAKATRCLVPAAPTQWAAEPFHEFGVGSPPGCGLGVLGPEYTWFYPDHWSSQGRMAMPWASFYHESLNRGVYFANHDSEVRSKVFRMAMSPGIAEKRSGGDWPRPEELSGLPAGVTINWVHFPYARPGETFVGAAVVLRCHEGGWQEGAAIYAKWFEQSFGLVDSRNDWLRRETAFLDTMFLLPEDNINLTFREITAWAKCAADHGIGSVLISGWQIGGHDRGYPQYEPDPRLGTWAELEAGIRACHDLGLRVYFFANVQTADISSEWYKDELRQYEIKDPWGEPYFVCGWGMGTVGARRGLTRTSHPEVRTMLVNQFRKLAQIGADGIHLDKTFVYPLDFNPRLTLSPDRAVPQGVLRCVEEILSACREIQPEFCVSCENNWDQLFRYSDVAWWAMGPSPLKVAFPQWVSTNSVTQPFSYNVVNQLVLGGQNIMIGPGNYMRGMDYPPMQELCRYVGEVTRIRRELHDCVSRGRWVDSHVKLFASQTPALRFDGPFASSPHAGWTVFADTQTGKRAAVLANMGNTTLEVGNLSMNKDAAGVCRVYQPFELARDARFPVTLEIPPERVAFVMETS